MSRINELDDERQKLRIELRNIADKLGETRAKILTVREELQQLRKTRDGLNDTVRALKKTRDALRDSSKEKLAGLREVLKKMSDRPHASLAEKELAALEWQVQTTPLGKEDEKRMMTKIRRLEISVTGYHKVLKLREEINKQREEADQLHARIQELAAESQKHHADIVQLSEAFQALRLKRETQQKALDSLRGKVADTNQQFVDLRNELTDEEKRIQREKVEALKVSLKGTAQKKLSKGEKLTLMELGALYEDTGDEE
jgi:phosphoserine phosphatase